MYLCEWINAYTKINNKLNKKGPLRVDELEELSDLIEKLQTYINKVGFEVMKRQ